MSRYRFVDWATQGYMAFTALVMLFGRKIPHPAWPWLPLTNFVAMAAVHGLIVWASQPNAPKLIRFLREFYPILLYTLLYNETGPTNQMLGLHYRDRELMGWEHRFFGFQPSVEFMRVAPWIVWSELMYAAYFSYYLMIAGVGVWLCWRQREAFRHFIAVVSFVFYVCYTIYLFLPAVGPRAMFRESPERVWFTHEYGLLPSEPPENVETGPFYQLLQFIYRYLETWGAAFPSSHVAVAWTTLWFTWRYLPKLRYYHLTAAVLLCVSTVYCRYHYVLDVVAGLIAAAALVPLGNLLYRRFSAPTNQP